MGISFKHGLGIGLPGFAFVYNRHVRCMSIQIGRHGWFYEPINGWHRVA